MARSLVFKNGWWKNIPASIDQIDVAYQKKIEALFDQWPVFEKNIEWITEKNAGIALTFIVMGTVFYFVFSKQLNKRSWLLLPWVGICLGLSDLSSTLLKKFFGRLKPFVDHIGTGDVHHPPFSFPSNLSLIHI
mgnify:CR=1 FL=1